MKKLFFDGSCALCRHEIKWLGPKLQQKLQLVDISNQNFQGYQGASKQQMLAVIHLWDGNQFITGIDATLSYWQLAGWRFLPWLMSTPLCYPIAKWAYNRWAASRQRCSNNQCDTL